MGSIPINRSILLSPRPERLGITQPRVSEITRNKVELLSLDYLVGLCAKAGISVGLKIAA